METLVDVGLRNAAMAVPFALVALAAGRWVKRPALTHALWLLVLARLVLPPLWHVTVPRPIVSSLAIAQAPPVVSETDPPEADLEKTVPAEPATPLAEETRPADPVAVQSPAEPVSAPAAAATMVPPPAEPTVAWSLPPWRTMLTRSWLGGSCLIALVALVRVAQFQGALRRARIAPPSLQYQAGRVARQLGLSRSPAVWLVDGCVSPLLWGIVRPRLILPASLWAALDAGRRDALLAHELAHYARGDHWVRGLELVVGVLFWWHPAVWAARVKLREAEEQCCDAWVVWALPDGRRAYATALVDTVDFLSEGRSVLPALASGVGRVRHLKGRLTMIMCGNTPRRLPRLALMGLLSAGLALGTLGVSWAQDRPEPPPPRDRPSDAPRERKPDLTPQDRARPADDELRDELRRAREDFERARQRLEELERRLSGGRADNPRGAGRPGEAGRIGPGVPGDGGRGNPPGPGTDPRGRDTRPVPPGPGVGGPGGGPGVGPAGGGPGGFPGMPGRGPDNRGGGTMEERMQNMERMMQQIMQRLEQMDRGGRGNPTPPRGGGRPGAPGDGGRPGGPGGNGAPGAPGGPPPPNRDDDGGR